MNLTFKLFNAETFHKDRPLLGKLKGVAVLYLKSW